MTIEQRAQVLLAALDAHPNIFTDVPKDRLLADARAADARKECGIPLSPLDGQFLAVNTLWTRLKTQNMPLAELRSVKSDIRYKRGL